MGLFPIIKVFSALLKSPGDKFSAEVTKTGKQVVKLNTSEMKKTIVKHPTGRIVEYNSYKED
ncbi:MAG: hypothetical protein J6P14_02695 [Ruminococcus sp.]|nr:hypothetical protein [Ruminococcus sp.]